MAPSSTETPVSAPLRQPKRNLVLTFGANLGILGLTMATGTLNARLLGPQGRGELAAIQTIPSMIGMLALLGLPSAVGYFSARRPNETRAFTLTGMAMCLLASLPAMALGYLFMPWALRSQTPQVIHDARLYLAFIAVQAVVLLPYMALQGLGRFGIWNLLRIAPNIASLAAILIATLTGGPGSGRFAAWFLVTYAAIAPLAYGALWMNSTAVPGPPTRRAGEMLRYGLPSALMIPAGMLNLQLDQMLMAAWLPSQTLGLYAVSVSWSGMLSPAFGALGHVIFPALAATQDAATQRALVARSFRLAVIAVLALGTALAVVTPFMLPLLFGRSFAPAVPAALILVAAAVLLNLTNLSGEILRGLGAPRWPLFAQIAALPATVLLLVVLLPRWNLIGGSVTSLVAYAIAGFVCVKGITRTSGIRPRELLLPQRADYLVLRDVIRGVLVRLRP